MSETAATLPSTTAHILHRFGHERIPFEALRAKLKALRDPDSMHQIQGEVHAPEPHIVRSIAEQDRAGLTQQGLEAIARGELAVVILAGGMATRFGGVVKALAPLADDTRVRFLDAKLADVSQFAAPIDTTLMTSFATHDALTRALSQEPARPWLHCVAQFVALRLDANGELFLDEQGQPSPYATGHGDLPDAMQAGGAVARWQNSGVKTVLVMNVDNLGATVDPAIFATHLRSGATITAELVSKRPGDKGGVALMHNGAAKLCEAFRLPSDFAHDSIATFNTNTLWINVAALADTHEWTWCVARKKVGAREAIQLERLVGELTWFYPTQYVHVSRDGVESRFLPVKDVADLQANRALIEAVLKHRVGVTL
jgi:UTP--glucose-1-phosphate uridylyltransferase